MPQRGGEAAYHDDPPASLEERRNASLNPETSGLTPSLLYDRFERVLEGVVVHLLRVVLVLDAHDDALAGVLGEELQTILEHEVCAVRVVRVVGVRIEIRVHPALAVV